MRVKNLLAISVSGFVLVLLFSSSALPQMHSIFMPSEIQWVDAPPSLPPGAKIAVLDGDLSKEVLFTFRLKFPAGYKVPPHWHPILELVTVISGSFYLGMGEKYDESAGTKMPTGSLSIYPAKNTHFVWTNEETVLQLHGNGPFGVTYINPEDDPRNKK